MLNLTNHLKTLAKQLTEAQESGDTELEESIEDEIAEVEEELENIDHDDYHENHGPIRFR